MQLLAKKAEYMAATGPDVRAVLVESSHSLRAPQVRILVNQLQHN
jgi:hypothetical protein